MRTAIPSLLLFLIVSHAGAGDSPPPAPVDLSGNWSGYWKSGSNNHRGPLRASFCKLDETRYRVDFRGRFFAVIPFRYSVTLEVTRFTGDKVLLAGSSRIPIFGVFEYRAEAMASEFVSTFQSASDHGVFVLHRRD